MDDAPSRRRRQRLALVGKVRRPTGACPELAARAHGAERALGRATVDGARTAAAPSGPDSFCRASPSRESGRRTGARGSTSPAFRGVKTGDFAPSRTSARRSATSPAASTTTGSSGGSATERPRRTDASPSGRPRGYRSSTYAGTRMRYPCLEKVHHGSDTRLVQVPSARLRDGRRWKTCATHDELRVAPMDSTAQ
jgi:hypothetical protein